MLTRDKNIVINSDLVVGHTYEIAVVARNNRGQSQDIEMSPHAVITIAGKTLSPNVPTGLTTTVAMFTVFLEWVNPADMDIDVVEVWRSNTSSISGATVLATVKGNHYADNLGAAGVTRYYWVRVRNKSGVYSDYNTTVGVSATSGAVVASTVDDFAITATKMFTNTIVLTGDVWGNSDPLPNYISWNAHHVVYGGVSYAISAGNTNAKYVSWAVGATTYSTSATHPTSGFTIAVNTAGVHTLVWNNSANMVIGTAYIADLAVTNAKINTMAADKLTAGTIDASVITVTNLNADNITAGTLTGRVVRTAASGTRAVIDSADNTVKMYVGAGATPLVTLGAGGSGGAHGVLSMVDGASNFVYVYSNGYIQVSGSGIASQVASGQSIYLYAGDGNLILGEGTTPGNTVFYVTHDGAVLAQGVVHSIGGFTHNFAAGISGTCTVKVGGADKTLTFSGGIITGLA